MTFVGANQARLMLPRLRSSRKARDRSGHVALSSLALSLILLDLCLAKYDSNRMLLLNSHIILFFYLFELIWHRRKAIYGRGLVQSHRLSRIVSEFLGVDLCPSQLRSGVLCLLVVLF